MKIWSRYIDTVRANWHHGFTCFGGPAVQFQTFHDKFVDRLQWIDEPMYQQIFCLSQSLPGSASVKMLFCINAIHANMAAGFIAMVFFCLPGAIAMFGLALGIAKVGKTLPIPVYSLLSGLNAATVGIIALAGVRLAGRAINDKVTRLWVCVGGVMGTLYTALWYYPVILAGAGLTTLLYDYRWPHRFVNWVRRSTVSVRSRRSKCECHCDSEAALSHHSDTVSLDLEKPLPALPRQSRSASAARRSGSENVTLNENTHPNSFCHSSQTSSHNSSLPTLGDYSGIPPMSWQLGSSIIALFLLTFIMVTALAHMLPPDRLLSVFSALYQAGTIIVGGGPVVIPLLQDYLVTPGWVQPRDFLLGLAIIQAFPGPNFNFAIYLGALAVAHTKYPSYLGALIAFIGMYGPGIFIMVGFMGLWRIVQGRKWFEAVLRGINAAAVGLVFTAVWKLWQIGRLQPGMESGSPLGDDPWLVGITGMAYVGGAWFGLSPPVAILLGGALGVGRWAVLEA